MNAYTYDIEVYQDFFSAIFKNVKSKQVYTFCIYDIENHKKNDLRALLLFARNNILIGFNSKEYDNLILNYLYTHFTSLISKNISFINQSIYKQSVAIIQKGDKRYKYNLPFKSCDLMAIGNIKTSLKHIGVLLKHPVIQDLPYPFDKPIGIYERVPLLLKYNLNDVSITETLYHKLREQVLSRLDIEKKEGIVALDSSDSGISNALTIKMYSEITGLSRSSFTDLRTYRREIELKDCISPIVKYKSKELKEFLESVKKIKINGSGKADFQRQVKINKTYYTIGVGGIHDAMKNVIRVAKDGYIIKDADVGSYYPRIIEKFDCFPKHFDHRVKVKYSEYTDERLRIKKSDPVKAKILKIVLNSFYGKYGSDTFFLYDTKAMYSVTLNGQLSLLMLIESLEEAGIEVFSANTDGITAYFHKDKEEEYNRICKEWEEYTQLELEYAYYDQIYLLNCNNYFVVNDGKISKAKGQFANDIIYEKNQFDPTRSFNMPIVQKAVVDYFVNKIPVRKTIEEHKDILDFCICQNKDKKYHYVLKRIVDGEYQEEHFDYTTRFYASRGGGLLVKSDGESEEAMLKNQNVTILNNIDAPHPSENPVDYDFYVRKAINIIDEFIVAFDTVKLLKSTSKKVHPKNQLSLL